MRKRYLNIFWVFLVICCIGCSEFTDVDPIPPLDPATGKSYFFLEEGKYRECNVFEIRYLAVDRSDTLIYQLREEVGEPFDADNAESAHLLYRYKRPDSSQDWTLDSVWSARITGQRAIVAENNVSIIKMIFPTDTIQTWDRNLFNDKAQRIIRTKTFNEPYTVGFNTFLNASEIEINNRAIDSLILFGPDQRTEVYADSIGLVFKEFNVYSLCASQLETGCNAAGVDVIKSGRYIRMELTAHGNINDED